MVKGLIREIQSLGRRSNNSVSAWIECQKVLNALYFEHSARRTSCPCFFFSSAVDYFYASLICHLFVCALDIGFYEYAISVVWNIPKMLYHRFFESSCLAQPGCSGMPKFGKKSAWPSGQGYLIYVRNKMNKHQTVNTFFKEFQYLNNSKDTPKLRHPCVWYRQNRPHQRLVSTTDPQTCTMEMLDLALNKETQKYSHKNKQKYTAWNKTFARKYQINC